MEDAKETVEINEDAYIKVEYITKLFNQGDDKLQIIEDVSFSENKGEMVCIVGASGCGKSTLLRAIAGLDSDYSGLIEVNGEVVSKPQKSRGIVFQEPRLFPWMTVWQNVKYGLSGMNKEERQRLVNQHIKLVGLEGFEKAYPRQPSGGMAQRTGIA